LQAVFLLWFCREIVAGIDVLKQISDLLLNKEYLNAIFLIALL